jgi:HEAT repeat protein
MVRPIKRRDWLTELLLEAARWLETRPAENLRAPLRDALDDPHHFVRESAAHSLSRLEGDSPQAEPDSVPPEPQPHAIDDSDPPDHAPWVGVLLQHDEDMDAGVPEQLDAIPYQVKVFTLYESRLRWRAEQLLSKRAPSTSRG